MNFSEFVLGCVLVGLCGVNAGGKAGGGDEDGEEAEESVFLSNFVIVEACCPLFVLAVLFV